MTTRVILVNDGPQDVEVNYPQRGVDYPPMRILRGEHRDITIYDDIIVREVAHSEVKA